MYIKKSVLDNKDHVYNNYGQDYGEATAENISKCRKDENEE